MPQIAAQRSTRVVLCVLLGTLCPRYCAADPPSTTDILAAHDELRHDVQEIQGTFTLYREEQPRWEYVDRESGEIDLPVEHEGVFWRNEQRFRVDYTSPDEDGMLPGAAALDSGRVFEFVGDVATRPDALASLHIYDLDSPEAKGPESFIELGFLTYIDSLWSGGNIPHTNYLQRPSTTIIPNNTEQLPDAFSMNVRHGSETGRFEFANQHPHPHLRARIEHDQVTVERRVYSESTPHGCFPTRVIDVTELSDGSGYTEIMDLKLEPLHDESPVAQEFTAESFRNFEMTYQAYRDHGDGQELAERIYMDYVSPAAAEMETLQPAAKPNNPRIWFLWANGILIFLVVATLCVRRLIAQRYST